MSLQERTFRREVDKILKARYQEGRIPSPTEIETAINAFLNEYPPGQPRLKLRLHKRKQPLNLDWFNQSNEEIVEDLQLLYDALIGIMNDMTTQINLNQSVVNTLDRQLNIIKDTLDSIVLTSKNTSGYLFSVTENFNTLANIDNDNTTATVDLANQICTLRKLQKGSRRLSMMHHVASASGETHPRPEIRVISGDDVELRQETPFANAVANFNDTAFLLIYSAPKGPVTVRLEFRVPPPGTETIRISRLDLKPVGEYDMRVFYTNENREEKNNWLFFPGLEDTVRVDRRSSYAFEARDVAWMRIEMTKNTPDREERNNGDVRGLYQFGMECLELFSYGYAGRSILQTKPLLPEGSEFMDSVGKLSLDVSERPRPEGTDIKYFVRLEDDNQPWIPIAPVNRPTEGDASRIVDFGGAVISPRRDNRFRTTSPTLYERRNAIDFYSLYTLPNTPVFGSARLYPGLGAWHKGDDSSEVLRTISNNYLVFTTNDDKQHLYLTNRNEEATKRDVGGSVYLDMENIILQQDGMQITAPSGGSVDQNPLYSVERILRVSGVSPVSGSSATINRRPNLPPELQLNESVANPDTYIGQYIYINDGTNTGYFKINNQYTDGSNNTVFVLASIGSLFGVSVSWRLDIQDVTDNVVQINGLRTLVTDLTPEEGEKFLVTYRYRLNDNQEIVEGSVRLRIPGQQTQLEPGRDYAVDFSEKTVQRLSDRINAGAGTSVSAVADYQIRETITGPTVYTTYVDVTNRVDVNLRSITIDRAEDEFFRILPVANSAVASVEDAASGGVVTLQGTMVFVVGSKDLFRPDGSINTDSALYKVINLRDTSNNYVFDTGRYFDRMYAIAEPMEQTTLTRLRALAPNDLGKFAVDDNLSVVVNHDPTTRDDLLIVLPGQTAQQSYADFEIGYQFVPTESSGIKQVRVRAELFRDQDTDGSVTPVIESFTLRYS